jgi:peptidyl-prolyl cis-trans isomerase D
MIKFLQTPTQAKKIVLGAVLAFVSLMMVITLVPGIFDNLTGASKGVYAKVAGQDITTAEVDREAQQIARQQRLPAEFVQFIRPQAANQLVTRYALIAEAHRLGLNASDEEVRNFLHQGQFGEALFPQGNFIGQENYERFLSDNFRMSVQQFEDAVKQQLLVAKLLAVVQGTVTVPEKDVEQDYLKENRKVKFNYAVLTMEDLMKQVKVTDPELQAFYTQHKKEYENSIPEKRAARYVVISASTLPAVTVSDDDLRHYYSVHQKEYDVPERVHVRHILVKTPPPGPDGKVDPKADEAAKAKAQDLLNQIKKGADFAELAKKNSDDPGSAKEGGELPAFQHGAMVAEFEKAAFGLQNKGQLSDLVKSTYGYHIIQLIDKQTAHTRSFDEVKAEIEPIVKNEKQAAAAEQLARTVEAQAKTEGLDKAAAAHNLKVETSGLFAQTDSLPGVGQSPEFMQVAFSQKAKSPPQLARIANGYAVLEVTDSRPPATPTFEEARAKVEADFRNQQAQSMLDSKTRELADRAKALHDLKKAAAEAGATYKTSDFVAQTGQVPDIGSMSGPASVVFTLAKGDISGPVIAGRNGAVLQVVDQQQPSPEEFAKSKDAAREQLLARKRGEMTQIYAQDLVAAMEKDKRIRYFKEEERPAGNLNPSGT